MAKLGIFYSLCPLIDQRSLLGVTEDVVSGHVIVTLGKNIAIKYRLSDQKQIVSWRTKDKFTSPVIYDESECKYAAAFNQSYIRMWQSNEEHLDKQKKFKLRYSIHTIIKCNNKSFIIFNNGAIESLNNAIKNRKELQLEKVINEETEYISEILQTDVYIGLIVKNYNNDDIHLALNVLQNETEKPIIYKLNLSRPQFTLSGCVFSHCDELPNFQLFTLWSDGKLFSYPIYENLLLTTETTLKPPGNLYSIIDTLSCKYLVTMVALNQDYIAMYGGNCNEEGAILNVYNLQFKVTQSKHSFKMFSNGAKIWKIENNLLLCTGQNLAVIPFHLDTEQLVALIGSHKPRTEQDADVSIVQTMQVATWDKNMKIECRNELPKTLKQRISEYLEQGWSLNMICEELIPQLIKENNLYLIKKYIKHFKVIPESCIVMILKYILNAPCEIIKKEDLQSNSAILRQTKRQVILNEILSLPFTDMILIPKIRQELSLNESVTLISYITYLLSSDVLDNEGLNELKLIHWGNAVLDANYMKFLLSKEAKISEILIEFNELVGACLESLNELEQVEPLLDAFTKGKVGNIRNKSFLYCIENLSLY